MRSAAWALTFLLPMWVSAEKYVLWNSQTCDEQVEDGISFSRYATYNEAIECFSFFDNVVASSVSQSKDTTCQVYTGKDCTGSSLELQCTAGNLFDPRLCCTTTPQGIRSARCSIA
ncbi:hypothetical protein V8C42DRAFT_334879 [Trichoderma barbatum]